MPVTKTAKRALKGSRRKEEINKKLISSLEIAVRVAKKTKSPKDISKAFSIADRAKKKHAIHKNKAARIKSRLEKLYIKKSAVTSKSKKRVTKK